jgi:hypothetical protein
METLFSPDDKPEAVSQLVPEGYRFKADKKSGNQYEFSVSTLVWP